MVNQYNRLEIFIYHLRETSKLPMDCGLEVTKLYHELADESLY